MSDILSRLEADTPSWIPVAPTAASAYRRRKEFAQTSPQPHSYFLQLPGEIRDVICEHALTSLNNNLYYHLEENGRSTLHEHVWQQGCVEFNQLKHACRQLYAETAGIELRLNTIVFLDETDHVQGAYVDAEYKAIRSYVSFISTLPSVWQKGLTKVIFRNPYETIADTYRTPFVSEAFLPTLRVMDMLLRLCDMHPTVQFHLEPRRWHTQLGPRSFIHGGILLYEVFRPGKIDEMFQSYRSSPEFARGLRERLLGNRTWPTNLRIKPQVIDGPFDCNVFAERTRFHQSRMRHMHSNAPLRPHVKLLAEKWTALAQYMVENGV